MARAPLGSTQSPAPDSVPASEASRLPHVLRNAGRLLSGNVAASLLNLVALALTARALGPEAYGTLAVIVAYVFVVDKLVNFQSWQALIKYGAEALERKSDTEFRQVVKFAFLLDAGTALLGTVIAAAAAPWVGALQGWSREAVMCALIYSVTIAFNLSGMPTAALRLFDRFDLLASREVLAAAVKLAGVGIVFALGGGFRMFFAVWVVTQMFRPVYLFAAGCGELRRRGHGAFLAASVRGVTTRFHGLWKFVWSTNLNSSIKTGSSEFDVLIVGGVLGASAAGLYSVAKRCAKVAAQLTDPLYHAIYPELAKLWAQHDRRGMVKLMCRSGLLAGSVVLAGWLVALAAGRWALETVFGVSYAAAFPALLWYMGALVVSIYALPLQPAMLAMGRPHTSLRIMVAGTAVYLPLLWWCVVRIGLVGAGAAYAVYAVLVAGMMLAVEYRALRVRGGA